MITMKDIAKEAKTSQATVSRVLNGNLSVDPEVKRRVMECISKYNYQPNLIAKSLVGSKSMLIGVIIPDNSNPFFADLVKSIDDSVLKYGYSIILCNTNGNPEKEKYYINILKRYNADGIIMVPRNTNEKFFIQLSKHSIPVVIATMSINGFDSISVSHFDAGADVAKHLANMGFSRFVFVGDADDEKERGFISGLAREGFIVERDYSFIDLSTENSLREKLIPLISDSKHFGDLGIFAKNDVIALIVSDFLKEYKVKMPEDVGLIGFDNTFIGKAVSPTISSVAQPINEIGRLSVETLMDRIHNNKSHGSKHILLESRIVIRESTLKMNIV